MIQVVVSGTETASVYHTRECRAVRRARKTKELDTPQPHWRKCSYCSDEHPGSSNGLDEKACPLCGTPVKLLSSHLPQCPKR